MVKEKRLIRKREEKVVLGFAVIGLCFVIIATIFIFAHVANGVSIHIDHKEKNVPEVLPTTTPLTKEQVEEQERQICGSFPEKINVNFLEESDRSIRYDIPYELEYDFFNEEGWTECNLNNGYCFIGDYAKLIIKYGGRNQTFDIKCYKIVSYTIYVNQSYKCECDWVD